MEPIPDSAARWATHAQGMGLDPDIHVFPEGTKTAPDAARAIGCEVGAIVKSLVFDVDGTPTISLIPGDRRLDTGLLATAAGGEAVTRSQLATVRLATGYVAGGTPPFGHATTLRVFADVALRRHATVWGAAGTPTTVFPISIEDLDRLASPTWAVLSQEG